MSSRTKRLRRRGALTVAQKIKSFKVGATVVIAPKPLFEGLPALRYINRRGTIIEKRGSSYVVEIKDGGKKKHLISHPVHIKSA
jgi:large subunit ribosomal protein L21e